MHAVYSSPYNNKSIEFAYTLIPSWFVMQTTEVGLVGITIEQNYIASKQCGLIIAETERLNIKTKNVSKERE